VNESFSSTTIIKSERAPILWLNEAAVYLGFDRLGVKAPERMIHRMVQRGVLRARKICGRLAFLKADLDAIAERGDRRPRRGRPPKKKLAGTE
jgi:hypothetical protein